QLHVGLSAPASTLVTVTPGYSGQPPPASGLVLPSGAAVVASGVSVWPEPSPELPISPELSPELPISPELAPEPCVCPELAVGAPLVPFEEHPVTATIGTAQAAANVTNNRQISMVLFPLRSQSFSAPWAIQRRIVSRLAASRAMRSSGIAPP